jgi:fumarate hydratase subunit alpha
MRELNVIEIQNAVKKLFLDACCNLGQDAVSALEKAHKAEESPFGKEILSQLLENAAIAHKNQRPCCQDTGMAVLFMDLGQEVHLVGGDLNEAVNEGVRQAYGEGFLRKSVVGDPLNRVNTGDNTPAILHVRIVPGDQVKLVAAPKGFGSENMSALAMLKPAQGIEGVKNFIVETVKKAGGNPCPPVVVGVGIGGTVEKAALLAKEQLTREVGQPSADPQLAQLEREVLERINALGIGPMGLGGRVTALAVHAASFATHIAGLPVVVNMQCHAARHKSIIL